MLKPTTASSDIVTPVTSCAGNDCADTSAVAANGLPYLILIITLVLCSILLATIALIIIVVVTRHRRKRLDSVTDDTAISYDDLAKPGLTAMEVQPDMRNLEPRGDPRAYLPFAPLPPRRFAPQASFDGQQRRLIPVPEEEGSADEGRASTEDLFNFPASLDYNNGNLGDEEGEGEPDMEGDTDVPLPRKIIPYPVSGHRLPRNKPRSKSTS